MNLSVRCETRFVHPYTMCIQTPDTHVYGAEASLDYLYSCVIFWIICVCEEILCNQENELFFIDMHTQVFNYRNYR